MIELYAIINEDHVMETYIRSSNSRQEMQSLIKHALKIIKTGESKTIKCIRVERYHIYYFCQASFIFMLATMISNRAYRMHNYLRVVADIFYENYDEKKFHFVLDRILDQINKNDFGGKKQNSQIEDEQSSLVSSNVQEEKEKLNALIQRRQRQSLRAYIVMSVLFFFIVILAGFYLVKKWN